MDENNQAGNTPSPLNINQTEPQVAPSEQQPVDPEAQPVVAEATSTESQPTTTEPQSDPAKTNNKPKKSRKKIVGVTAAIVAVIIICAIPIILNSMNHEDPKTDQTPETPAVEPISELKITGNSLSDFDLSFLKLEGANENIVYSPLSIKYALSMLSDGAAGDSKTQITNVLGDYLPTAYLNNKNRSLANAMFIRDTKKDYVLESYTDTLKQNYNADVVYDSFNNANAVNNWVSDQTLGIINHLMDDESFQEKKTDFVLVNALAIDMNWNNKIQASNTESDVKYMYYSIRYPHENYYDGIDIINETADNFDKITFNDQEVPAAKIGTTANRYDIVSDLGEDYIRTTVEAAHEKWLEENPTYTPDDYNIDEYMEELKSSYGDITRSTDYYFLDTNTEKVFAKDLQQYDGKTLQYVGIMPKTDALSNYISNLTAEKAQNIINNLKDSNEISSYKEGVITKIVGHIPFFKYNYKMRMVDDLKELGIKDVFSEDTADLSALSSEPKTYINQAVHQADIEFSNEGIKAVAATALGGGLGSAGPAFDYLWDVPVEEIDLTFDQPFLYIIRDKSSGEVWFTGTVYNPAA